ncbi:MAG: hypothetical protein AB7L94_14495 [Kofleriaceae bacterium]
MQGPLISTSATVLQRAVLISVVLHALFGAVMWVVHPSRAKPDSELIDIEIAPIAPKAEALPAEVARTPEEDLAGAPDDTDPSTAASNVPTPPENDPSGFAIDAGIDAPPDAAPDAPVDAAIDAPADAPIDAAPDAPIDAGVDAPSDAVIVAVVDAVIDAPGEPAATDAMPLDAEPSTTIALADAGVAEGTGDADVTAALGDAGAMGDATLAASGSAGEGAGNAGSGAGSATGSAGGSIAMLDGSGSGRPGQTDEPPVEGEPTTAGTAANLLTYFPRGHIVTALIRFDRMRGTEWAEQTERLLRPMPDYQLLFANVPDAKIVDKLEMLVISTPKPKDASSTTLVARTNMPRAVLRDFLGKSSKVAWSSTKGGLLGRRSGRMYQNDKRVFLSPFRGWFLLAQPTDLPNLLVPAKGDVDAIEATGKLPAWLGNIRKIEDETGGEKEPRGPALVVTIGLGGERIDLTGQDFGLGITTVPTPDRVSLAMELVKQGWLIRGNMRFGSEKEALEFIAIADGVKERVADSRAIQLVLGKQLVRVVANLSFARTGGRVSYATSVSIADARAILAALAQQLDSYFGVLPGSAPPPAPAPPPSKKP